MPPEEGRERTTEILGRGLALGPARLDQRLQVPPCSVRQHRPLLIPGGAKRPPSQSVQARTGPRFRFSRPTSNGEYEAYLSVTAHNPHYDPLEFVFSVRWTPPAQPETQEVVKAALRI